MTTSPSEPVDNPQLPDDAEPHGDGSGVEHDQDSEPTSTAPAEDNPTVPDPPD